MIVIPGAVAILGGTGQQGSGLARRLAAAGIHVVVGSRNPERARAVTAAWSGAVDVAANGAAVADVDTVVFAVPFGTIDALIDDVGPRMRSGAVAIDLTVPLTFAGGKMPAVALACAFKTVPAHLLDRVDEPLDCDEFVCGDSDAARERALALVAVLPQLRGVDVGPLSRARAIEQLTALAVAINRRHKRHDARFRVVGL
ncbi:MAG: hypothetical protein DMF93_02640 [Acidobacteria bacterium]|nr:MAG: hypothetical protein DMF93_02640 [Acidobacteriota bacterium]